MASGFQCLRIATRNSDSCPKTCVRPVIGGLCTLPLCRRCGRGPAQNEKVSTHRSEALELGPSNGALQCLASKHGMVSWALLLINYPKGVSLRVLESSNSHVPCLPDAVLKQHRTTLLQFCGNAATATGTKTDAVPHLSQSPQSRHTLIPNSPEANRPDSLPSELGSK